MFQGSKADVFPFQDRASPLNPATKKLKTREI